MYNSLQGCRALAAVLVMLGHLGGAIAADKYFGIKAFATPFAFGHVGVEFFFVLSGFIIAHVHRNDFGRPSRFTHYVRRRAIRILPTYWIVFGALYVAGLLFSEFRYTLPDDPVVLLKSLLLLPQDQPGGVGAPVVGAAWSLQYEMVFYAFVACLVLSRWLAVVLAGLFLINFGSCHIGNECDFPRAFFANTWMLLFALGVGTAYLSRSFRFRRPVVMAWIGGAAFVIVAGLELLARSEPMLDPMLDPMLTNHKMIYGLLSSLVILALVNAEDSGAMKAGNSWLSMLGDASYVLYLIHYPVISVLCKVLVAVGVYGTLGAVFSFVLMFCLCIMAALVFHMYVERPLLKYLSRPMRATTVARHGATADAGSTTRR